MNIKFKFKFYLNLIYDILDLNLINDWSHKLIQGCPAVGFIPYNEKVVLVCADLW